MTLLQQAQGELVDALAISADGAFLAAGRQSGTVWIWHLDGGTSITSTGETGFLFVKKMG
ncbi:hypothetical protein [Spirulina major]|jgi:WD40 repeat protein|uniref:hypothetical protein n=1 Tax=Spirulina major TaxID=270636 RepID=UPI0009343B11|nr:hypothetical protein [Spirulina major]